MRCTTRRTKAWRSCTALARKVRVVKRLKPRDERYIHEIRIDPLLFDQLDHLASGVVGYSIDEEDGSLWIPLIYAEDEGAGDVGRYLDSLPTDRTIVVPNVINPRLEQMLARRGFTERVYELTKFEQNTLELEAEGEWDVEPAVPVWMRDAHG